MDKTALLVGIVVAVVLLSAGWFTLGLVIGQLSSQRRPKPRYKRGEYAKKRKGRHAK
jgi:hypothetical protein